MFSVVLVFRFTLQSTNLPAGRQAQDGSALHANAAAVYEQEGLSAATGSGLPVRLKIPKIHVDAAVEYVGLAHDGAMDVPKSPSSVAWFNLGPHPGEVGSAVIAGHFGWKGGGAAVFDTVSTLHAGDKLYIEDEKGVQLTFVVREVRTYGKHEGTSGVFFSSDGKAHLNLITCEGVWSKAEKSYSNRLVVFTDKE